MITINIIIIIMIIIIVIYVSIIIFEHLKIYLPTILSMTY